MSLRGDGAAAKILPMMDRRHFLLGSLGGVTLGIDIAAAPLRSIGIDVHGDWRAPPQSAALVIARMREACLGGLTLRSDRQPTGGLRVDNRPGGPPAIWLHTTPADVAWIIVNVGERAWCQLAYQFGHELGHVLCNSWMHSAKPLPPSQWLEEALVESFSIRGLLRLAEGWAVNPPFPGDAGFSLAIHEYRAAILAQYGELAMREGIDDDPAAWFRSRREALEARTGLRDLVKAAVPAILAEVERDPLLIEDYAALNRWPERSAVPLEIFLRRWEWSCQEIGAPGRLPGVLRTMFVPE